MFFGFSPEQSVMVGVIRLRYSYGGQGDPGYNNNPGYNKAPRNLFNLLSCTKRICALSCPRVI